jgi:hypothetical protein
MARIVAANGNECQKFHVWRALEVEIGSSKGSFTERSPDPQFAPRRGRPAADIFLFPLNSSPSDGPRPSG